MHTKEIKSAVRPGCPSGALYQLERMVGFIVDGAIGLAALGILASAALIGYSVFMRYVLNAPPTWIDDSIGFMLAGIVMLGSASTLRKQKHICADTFTSRLGSRGLFWADMWGWVSVSAVSVVLILNGWETAMFSKMLGIYTNGNVQIPVFLLQLLLPVGGALMLLVSIEGALRRWGGVSAVADVEINEQEDQ